MSFFKTYNPLIIPGVQGSPLDTATTAVTIANYGQTIVQSTATLKTFKLAAPVKGVEKQIFCTQATTSLLAKVTLTGGASFFAAVGSGSTLKSVKFNHPNQSISLMGISSVRWGITGTNNSPTLSTSS